MESKKSSRAAIIEAAMKVFAERGIAGARIDHIIELAGLNVRMIYHHFGSKEGLYDEVLRTVVSQRNDVLPPLEANSSQEVLRQYIETFADFLAENEVYARIMGWESAAGWKTMSSVIKEGDFYPPHLMDALKECIDKGEVECPMPPKQLWLALNTLAAIRWTNPYEDSPWMEEKEAKTLYRTMLSDCVGL